MICCLTATINGEKRMRQMPAAEFATANPFRPRTNPSGVRTCGGQTGLIWSAPDCVNRFMLKQEQLVLQRGIVPFPSDDFFLQCQRLREFHSPKPTHIKRTSGGIHICI